ncbi:MAG: nickel pincer cofactor biosynthesis protein LarC [Planctomycetia bacterium]|nr:nickel pincer cofactor biosynthesis protein LarC [Planctomycetia bacterium]
MSEFSRILRWDSVGGASGDMILNALLSLCQKVGIPQEAVEAPLHELIPEPFSFSWETTSSHGMSGKVLRVEIPHSHEERPHHHHAHHHHHRTFADIRKMIEESTLPPRVQELSVAVFSALAQAEGEVHGMPAENVHFHEVGATDSLVDMVGACLAYDLLEVEGISLSPLPVGSGMVHCAHGTYPLPAPATALLLENHQLPVSLDNEEGEMLTPTAAALFAVWPRMDISTGMRVTASVNAFGHRKMISRPNLLRATLYEPLLSETSEEKTETLYQLECNLDDVSGEQLSAAMHVLFATGARDVWFSPLTMKKQRPGVLLGVLTDGEHRQKMVETLFRHSGTFGVREIPVLRHSLKRRWEDVTTRWGKIRMKIGTWQGEDLRFTPEFDDCQKIALAENLPWEVVAREAVRTFGVR